MRIGELSKLSGVPAKTIRYYEQIGVLPEPDRTESNYRAYGRDALARLSFVRRAQGVGLSLGEIKGVIAYRERGEPPCGHVAELITRRAGEIDAKIAELEGMRAELRTLARRAARLSPADCTEDGVCHVIPKR